MVPGNPALVGGTAARFRHFTCVFCQFNQIILRGVFLDNCYWLKNVNVNYKERKYVKKTWNKIWMKLTPLVLQKFQLKKKKL